MENVETPEPTPQSRTVGQTLLKAREDAGLSRADIASRTKVAERHILSIEEDRFEDLAARTYAVGFSRAYARAVGLDEKMIADMVRSQLDANEPYVPVAQPSFEPGDPARIPSSGMAWLALGAVVLVIGLVVYFWSSVFSPEVQLPSLLADETPTEAPATQAAAVAAPTPAAVPTGPVVLTSNADQIWMRVTDGSGKTLVEKVLGRGESWTVPDGVVDPQLRTGRGDALAITVGGQAIPALADKPQTISGVSLKPADLIARTTGATSTPAPANDGVPATSANPTPVRRTPRAVATSSPAPTPSPASTPTPARTMRPSGAAAGTPSPRTTSSARATPSGAPVSILPPSVPAPVSTTSE